MQTIFVTNEKNFNQNLSHFESSNKNNQKIKENQKNNDLDFIQLIEESWKREETPKPRKKTCESSETEENKENKRTHENGQQQNNDSLPSFGHLIYGDRIKRIFYMRKRAFGNYEFAVEWHPRENNYVPKSSFITDEELRRLDKELLLDLYHYTNLNHSYNTVINYEVL